MNFDRIRIKAEARACLSGANPHPMLVTLIYLLLTSGVSMGGNYVIFLLATGSPLRAIAGLFLGGQYLSEELLTGAFLLPFLFFTIVMALFSAVLSAGYMAYAMHLARGQEGGFQSLFNIFSMAGKVLLTDIWQTLCMLPWLLLGTGVYWVLGVILLGMGSFGIFLFLVPGMIGFLVYCFWVMLRYSLTYFFLLDEPESGAREAVRNSVTYMKGWKWELFKLELSFLGWQLLSVLTLGILGLWVTPYYMASMANFYDFVTGRFPRPPKQEALDPPLTFE